MTLLAQEIYNNAVSAIITDCIATQAQLTLVILPSDELSELPPIAFTDKLLVVSFDFTKGNWVGEQVSVTTDKLKCCLVYDDAEYSVELSLFNIVQVHIQGLDVLPKGINYIHSTEFLDKISESKKHLYFPSKD